MPCRGAGCGGTSKDPERSCPYRTCLILPWATEHPKKHVRTPVEPFTCKTSTAGCASSTSRSLNGCAKVTVSLSRKARPRRQPRLCGALATPRPRSFPGQSGS